MRRYPDCLAALLAVLMSSIAESALAAPQSYLALHFGPAYEPMPNGRIVAIEPTSEFTINSFTRSETSVSVNFHIRPINSSNGGVTPPLPPGHVCICITQESPLPPPMFVSFSLPNKDLFRQIRLKTGGFNSDFFASFPFWEVSLFGEDSLFQNSITDLTVGELQSTAVGDHEELRSLALDFRMQRGRVETAFERDPETGYFNLRETFVQTPGNWIEGSLRYHTSAPAYAFLDHTLPEPTPITLLVMMIPIAQFAASLKRRPCIQRKTLTVI